ncbi:hypothetical protein HYY75_10665, partial [bacterium]|nr:hypothetical protein [bacterium]
NVKSRLGALQANVVDKSGLPLEGALVSWYFDRTRWGFTNSSGTAFVDGLEFGEQPFIVEKPGYRAATFRANIYSESISVINNVVLETASFEYKDITVKSLSATHAVVSWKTTDYTNGVIEYGETESFGQTSREPERQYATVHELTLQNLKPEKRYFFKIVAARQNRPSETSPISNFITKSVLEDTFPPETPRGIAAALTEQPNQITISWVGNTEPDLRGYKVYRSDYPPSGFSAINNVTVPKGSERYVDVALVTGKKYFYRVSAVDQAGNEGSSSDIVSMVSPGDLTQEVSWVRSNSPYDLAGDIDIQSTGKLRIDPGVVVKMADYDSLRRGDPSKVEIRVLGAIIASGTPNDPPVIFTSSNPTPKAQDWGGIFFNRAPNDQSVLSNVTIGFANIGLSILQTRGTFSGIDIISCSTGVSASSTSDLSLASVTVKFCDLGMLLQGNTRITLDGCTTYFCPLGVTSSQNDTANYRGNNFLEYNDFGLTIDDKSGDLLITNNLFVSPQG